jgi:hypothetical protein
MCERLELDPVSQEQQNAPPRKKVSHAASEARLTRCRCVQNMPPWVLWRTTGS